MNAVGSPGGIRTLKERALGSSGGEKCLGIDNEKKEARQHGGGEVTTGQDSSFRTQPGFRQKKVKERLNEGGGHQRFCR